MEPSNFKLQQVTFDDGKIQDADFDSFNNVIHYDSALIDLTTGNKICTSQVTDSSTFAWSSSNSLSPHSQASQLLPTLVAECSVPTKHQNSSPLTHDLAREISQMVKDVYSEKEIAFAPIFNVKKTKANQFSSTTDYKVTNKPEHIIAQPSKVKVTHVYNQSVWSEVPVTGTQVTHFLINADTGLTSTTAVTDCDIRTLLQVSSNTSAAKRHLRTQCSEKPLAKMAERQTDSTQPFESVAEALHLQKSVIGNKTITPVSPEIVAQIVAEAERKLKTSTPAQTTNVQIPKPSTSVLDTGVPQTSVMQSKEISAESGLMIGKTPSLTSTQTHPTHTQTHQTSGDTDDSSVDANDISQRHLIEESIHRDTSYIPDDRQSIASSNSELELLSEKDTENFLKNLPPFKPLNLSELLPKLSHPAPFTRSPVKERFVPAMHSPPVKETSFRPVVDATKSPVSPQDVTLSSGYHSFVTDSGVLSPEAGIVSPLQTQASPQLVIPKPGPLFKSPPLQNTHHAMPSNFLVRDANKTDSSTTMVQEGLHLEELRRENAKLEGQLEMLSIEAQATLQERAELQAQVASLKLKLMSKKAYETDSEKGILKADIDSLKQLRITLEQSVIDLQAQLDERSEEARNLQEELSQSQEICDRLNLKMKEVRDDLKSKDMTIQALKNKVAELYVEVQTSLQKKMEADSDARSAKSDLVSLQSAKQWYQQQLEIATKARSELQRELTTLQAQAVSQSSIIERLKTENIRLKQQLTEVQQKALKEKELLAKHLETIESDMMDREAAFQEIQRERTFLEDTFNTKIQTAEDEKSRIALLMQMTNDLEARLDKAQSDLKQKQNQIYSLENENMDLLKKLTLSQEHVMEKDGIVEELKQNLIEVQTKLGAFQNSLANKDTEILRLKEEKATTEIALKSALQEKNAVDKVLESLKLDMGKVEKSFKLMKHELTSKSDEMNKMRSQSSTSTEQMESLKTQIESLQRNYEVAMQDFTNRTEQINTLQSQKVALESEIIVLKEKLSSVENAHEDLAKEKQSLDAELWDTRAKLNELQLEKAEIVEKEQTQKLDIAFQDSYTKLEIENSELKQKLVQAEKDSKKEIMKHKAKTVKLNNDLKAVQTELTDRQGTFDTNIELLSSKLREIAAEKEKIEIELDLAQRKYELGMVEKQDQVQNELQVLASELEQLKLQKQELEVHLSELQRLRDLDLQQYQQQVAAFEQELSQALEERNEARLLGEHNQNLALELEKEKGRLAGMMQSNTTLKQHVSQLEEALAGRESTLVDLQTQMHQTLKEKELESHQNIKRVQTLEESLQKEKDGQREIRKQVGLKITENKKLKRHNDGLKQELDQLRQELESKTQEVTVLNADLDSSKQNLLSHQAEIKKLGSENKAVARELERVQQQLSDSEAREPVIQEQIQSLECQLQLRNSELEASQQQMKIAEERQQEEIENIKYTLKEKNLEIEGLKLDINSLKHEKQVQQARIAELRSALKSSIQHHRLTHKFSKLQRLNGGSDAENELPSLPFDLEEMDKLVQESAVRALESKPLDNLQNCLSNLRSEISGLQQQMDNHANTIETSTNTWSILEKQVEELRSVVQTISNTTMATATTTSIAAAAVDAANSLGIIEMGVSNLRDDYAERNRGYAEVPLSTVIQRVGNAHLQQNPILDSFSCTAPPKISCTFM